MTNITEYSIGKHRFYELKHFCMQYPEWTKLYSNADGYSTESGKSEGDTTSKDGITRAQLNTWISLLQRTAHDTGYNHWASLLAYITGTLKRPYPDQGDLWWYYYQKFFWLLSQRRL